MKFISNPAHQWELNWFRFWPFKKKKNQIGKKIMELLVGSRRNFVVILVRKRWWCLWCESLFIKASKWVGGLSFCTAVRSIRKPPSSFRQLRLTNVWAPHVTTTRALHESSHAPPWWFLCLRIGTHGTFFFFFFFLFFF